jgi:Flp pilus assembly protein TadG
MRNFWRSEGGNVAVLFAVALLPVVGTMGVALDYSRGNDVKVKMQAALDSTALALAKEPPGTPLATLQAKGNEFFRASFGAHDVTDLAVTVTPASGVMTVQSTGKVPTTLAHVVGTSYLDIGVQSVVRWGTRRLDVALVLDNTGSMGWNGKIEALRTATRDLLDVFEAASPPGQSLVRVSIVPFDTRVNVGTGNANQPWMRDQGSIPPTWNGCVIDRDQQHDVRDTLPDRAVPGTLFIHTQCSGLAALRPLTSDFTALRQTAGQLQAAGMTNITIGLAWGWHSLSQRAPLGEGFAPGTPDLDRAIILLTDGDNTQNRWTTNRSQIDNRTRAACNNIKAEGITVYTVRVIEGNASLLRNCASDPAKYFDVQNVGALSSVFQAIGTQLTRLHISR